MHAAYSTAKLLKHLDILRYIPHNALLLEHKDIFQYKCHLFHLIVQIKVHWRNWFTGRFYKMRCIIIKKFLISYQIHRRCHKKCLWKKLAERKTKKISREYVTAYVCANKYKIKWHWKVESSCLLLWIFWDYYYLPKHKNTTPLLTLTWWKQKKLLLPCTESILEKKTSKNFAFQDWLDYKDHRINAGSWIPFYKRPGNGICTNFEGKS